VDYAGLGDAIAEAVRTRFQHQLIAQGEVAQKGEMGVAMARERDVVAAARCRGHRDVSGPKGEGVSAGASQRV